jgi:hypothetical protein
MNDFTVAQAQADMRVGYLFGAPGVAASSLAWLAASAVALNVTPRAGVWALLIGGAFIFPVSVLFTKLLGGPGKHSHGNPLGGLAIEGTLWMMAGIAVAVGVQVLRLDWFFPAMLLVIGGRYLTFQTLYGMRIYWLLGAVLCVAGIALALVRAPAHASALTGGLIELVFALGMYAWARRSASGCQITE